MELADLDGIRREQAHDRAVLARVSARVEARRAAYTARCLPSARRAARIEELDWVLALLNHPEED